MNSVLFVDDDANVLQGLRRMLRPFRDEWYTAFANTGEAALTLLEKEYYDVIVSDTKMPGMNGVELLREAQQRYPGMIRIGLSGHSDEELALQSTKTTHQQLAKPCNAETLRQVLSKAIELRDKVVNDSLTQIITTIDSLPVRPEFYQQITETMEMSEGSLHDVADIISRDIAMMAKILQLVNSAFFGLARYVESIHEAVSFLGYDVLRSLVLNIEIFRQFETKKPNLNLDELWDESIRIGAIAKHIAVKAGLEKKDQDYAQMAGMLHDIGVLMLASYYPDEYSRVDTALKKTSQNICVIEKQIFGCSHMEIGAYLLGLWGLPDPIIDTVAYHHYPLRHPSREISSTTAVYIANILDARITHNVCHAQIDAHYLDVFNLNQQIEEWEMEIREKLSASGEDNACSA